MFFLVKKISRSVFFLLSLILIKCKPVFEMEYGRACLSKVKFKGENCVFEGGGKIIDVKNLRLGEDVYIGRKFFIRATAGVSIGSYTHISRNVTIHTVNHNISGTLLPYDREDIARPIEIGKYVWVGMNTNILPGVKIGDGAVVGMGTTVTKDVLPGEIVVGASQRVVGKRDSSHTQALINREAYLKAPKGD